MNKKLLLLVSLAISPIYADVVSPTYTARSQGSDAARKIAGVSDKTHLYDEGNYVNLAATAEYTRSFDQDEISRCLFGTDLCNCNQILIQGSSVQGDARNEKAWLADYFYLAPDYNSYFCINPTIQNALVDLDLFVGLDNIAKGLYLRLHGPITYTNWNLNFSEECDLQTTGSYDVGYFDHQRMLNNQLLQSFGDFAQGKTPLNTSGPSDPLANQGIQFMPLQYAKIDGCSHSRTGFADLRMELGWDFAQDDDYHFGLNAQIAAPTGNRTQAEFAFDPTVGNRNHWEAGAGVSAHYTFWRAQGEEKHAGFYLDLNVTHVNKATEQRTFDLCGRPNSRYMLAQKMGRPTEFLYAGDTSAATIPFANLSTLTQPNSQFQGVYSPVANLTTLNIQVSAAVQADLALMFNYSGENISFDLGYNFWIRSCDKFSQARNPMAQCCPSLCDGERNVWALKGDAHVFGFTIGTPLALSATQCGATIHNGTNATTSSGTTACTGNSNLTNCGVDNANFGYAQSGVSDPQRLLISSTADNTEGNHIKTSLEPKFINCCDINFQETRGLSNKIFTNLSYSWDKDSWSPYIGVGGFVEFGRNESTCNPCDTPQTFDCSTECDDTSCCQPACCTDCIDCSLSQWGVWLKGGIAWGESYERPKNDRKTWVAQSTPTKQLSNAKEFASL